MGVLCHCRQVLMRSREAKTGTRAEIDKLRTKLKGKLNMEAAVHVSEGGRHPKEHLQLIVT